MPCLLGMTTALTCTLRHASSIERGQNVLQTKVNEIRHLDLSIGI